MKYLILFMSMALSCGTQDKSEDEAPPPPPEISAIDTPTMSVNKYASPPDAQAIINFTATGTTKGWTYVAAIKEGDSAPSDCKTGDQTASNSSALVRFERLKPSTTYSVRVCLTNTATGEHTKGLTKTFAVPAS